MSAEQSAKLTPQLLMGQIDADADGKASRSELIDMLRRMKGFDAGHIQRSDAATPSGTIGEDEQIYGRSLSALRHPLCAGCLPCTQKVSALRARSHAERMKKKKKKKKKKSFSKDEV